MLLPNDTELIELNLNKLTEVFHIRVDDINIKELGSIYIVSNNGYVYRPIYYVSRRHINHSYAVDYYRFIARKYEYNRYVTYTDLPANRLVYEDDILVEITDHYTPGTAGWNGRYTNITKDTAANFFNSKNMSFTPIRRSRECGYLFTMYSLIPEKYDIAALGYYYRVIQHTKPHEYTGLLAYGQGSRLNNFRIHYNSSQAYNYITSFGSITSTSNTYLITHDFNNITTTILSYNDFKNRYINKP